MISKAAFRRDFTMPLPPRSGFTLVELLVVLGIVVLLLALAFPALQRSRSAATTAGCLSNLKQIGIGFHAYLGDNDMMIPPQPAGSGMKSPTGSFFGNIAPYAGWTKEIKMDANAAKKTFMHCPAHTEQPGSFSYRFSAFLVPSPSPVSLTAIGPGPLSYLRIKNPSKKVLAWDVHTSCQWPMTSRYDSGTGKKPHFPLFNKVTFTHNGGLTYLFADGHAECRNDSLSNFAFWRYEL